MNNQSLAEIFVVVIAIPYFTWVAVSIFDLKQKYAVMKAEMGLIKEIKEWIQLQRRPQS